MTAAELLAQLPAELESELRLSGGRGGLVLVLHEEDDRPRVELVRDSLEAIRSGKADVLVSLVLDDDRLRRRWSRRVAFNETARALDVPLAQVYREPLDGSRVTLARWLWLPAGGPR